MTRRQWLGRAGRGASAAGAASVMGRLLGCDAKPAPRVQRHFSVPGRIVGQPAEEAHRLRDGPGPRDGPAASGPLHDCIVVGAGIAGCSAVWKLRRAGVHDVILLELGDTVGGTSAWGQDGPSAHPWAAHYVTTPDAGADCLIEVLTDLGVLTGVREEDGWPIGNPAYVVRHPVERLKIAGQWTDDIAGATASDRAEREAMRGLRETLFGYMRQRDSAGRRAFTLPVAYGSSDPDVTRLDEQSTRAWLRERGFVGRRLEWNVEYACRDDYGATAAAVSAWAGIHYYACRYDDDRYRYQFPVQTYTWPEGNGFLIKGLLSGTPAQRVRTGTMVMAIDHRDDHVEVAAYDRTRQSVERLRARRCIFAGKLHVAGHVIRDVPEAQQAALDRCVYAPWLVGQVHVKRLPKTPGSAVAWDNVHYESDSLGYVVANHQTRWSLGPEREADEPAVLTYYQPFVEDAAAARAEMLQRDHAYWVDWILNDLSAMHEEIASLVTRVDVMLYGHAMIVPVPGFVFSDDRALRSAPIGRVHLASADATGLPLFEEACFHGLRAAEEVLAGLGRSFTTTLSHWKRT